MLVKLSIKNIQKSFKDYAIYFMTLILGVAIFYVFNAIESQTAFLSFSQNTNQIIELMIDMLSGISVFVSMILGFLILYASRFMIKRRNKEFGIYITLGMSKQKVSKILLLETLMIGLCSLVIGLGLGVVLSQLMSLLVANMFEADMKSFVFTFSSSACVKTIVYFGIIYFVVMIFNTINISRLKLIDLLQSHKKSETIKLKNPWLCVIVFVIACCMLGYAYYQVITNPFYLATDIMIPILLGIIGTFLVFWSVSGLILKVMMGLKSVYFRGLNSFTLRQISSKINTTVTSMSIICILLFVTICILSSSLSIKNSMNRSINELAPADIQFYTLMNRDDSYLEWGYSEKQIEHSNLTVDELYQLQGIDIDSYFEKKVDVMTYKTDELTLEDTLGIYKDTIEQQFPFMRFDTKEEIISIRDYNQIAGIFGYPTYELKEDEYLILADYDNMVNIRNLPLQNEQTITVFGHTLKPKYSECQSGIMEMSSNHINSGIIVVPDHCVTNKMAYANYLIANYKKTTSMDLDEELLALGKAEDVIDYIMPVITSRKWIKQASLGLGSLVTFVCLYLGVIFLLASAAILALKELSESADNKERFEMLRKLGADEKMIHRALFTQIGVFFLFPLVLALIHSFFGLQFSARILETFGNQQLIISTIITSLILVVIYGGYFLLTYFCSKNMLK